MGNVIWIDPQKHLDAFVEPLGLQGVEMQACQSVEETLDAISKQPVGAVIVAVDWPDAITAIERLVRERPEIDVLAATSADLPAAILSALHSGASRVLDLKLDQLSGSARQIRDAVNRTGRAMQEREFLVKLRDLNEEFLKNMLGLERRNIDLEDQLQPEAERLAEAEEAESYNILVVDDESTICELFKLILNTRGYNVVAVADGESALRAFQEETFHLVITDKNMPGMSGLDLLREVKKLRPEVDVILVTGYASKESAIEALNFGAASYIEKPFDDVTKVGDDVEAIIDKQRQALKKRGYLQLFKDRNKDFLNRYKTIRADLEAWLQIRGA